MIYEISKSWSFSASHSLPQLPPDHQCHRLHGHNYAVTVILRGDELTDGMLVDYGEMSATFGAWVKEHLDHRHLNDEIEEPTAEHLAALLWDVCQNWWWGKLHLEAVEVSETPTTIARVMR